MNRIEIQRALYESRIKYLKAKSRMEFYSREITSLKECERNLDKSSNWLYQEMFGNEVT